MVFWYSAEGIKLVLGAELVRFHAVMLDTQETLWLYFQLRAQDSELKKQLSGGAGTPSDRLEIARKVRPDH